MFIIFSAPCSFKRSHMDKLTELKGLFNPKRKYSDDNGTVIEVDGVFVRVDEDLEKQRGLEQYSISAEDFLQDPPVIRSARVSTGRDSKEVDEKAKGMIGALYGGRHETPFEGGVVFRLRVETPICFAQPFFQLPYSHNEFSGRYSIIDGDFYTPKNIPSFALSMYHANEERCQRDYKELLDMGVAREQARFALPFRFFTKFYWTVSLRHLLEILSLEPNNLTVPDFWSIRDNILKRIIKDWTPWAYEKTEETKRCVRTKWADDDKARELIGLIKGRSLKRFENEIGSIHLVNVSGDDDLLRLGIKTQPNPRRGFGHASMTFLMEVPIFVHRQWVRHRYGSWSELPVNFQEIANTRNFYIPNRFRKQVGKAMSYVYEDMNDEENNTVRTKLHYLIEDSCYRFYTVCGCGIESLRAAQTLVYTFRIPVMWTVNVESLMNFFSLRCDTHAQWEIRQFANVIYGWFKEYFPCADKIFLDHLNYGKSPVFGNS